MTDQFDTPGRDATPEEEARVRALLAGLRDDDIPMPDDVWSRLSAVIAEEQRMAEGRTAPGAPGAAEHADDEQGSGSGGTVTVLPVRSAPRRRRGASAWLLGAAAAVVGIALVGGLVKGLQSGDSFTAGGASAADAASAAPSVGQNADATRESSSGTAYSHTTLRNQAQRLIARSFVGAAGDAVGATGDSGTSYGAKNGGSAATGATTGSGAALGTSSPTSAPNVPAATGGQSATPGSAAGDPEATPPLLSGAALTECVAELTGDPTVSALAVDRGTFNGKPVDVVVVPTAGDPTHLDVWVVEPGCTKGNAQVVEFQRIARP